MKSTLSSWMRPDKNDEESYFTYWQIAEQLVPYVKDMGFTHVELMPVMEYPFDGSWGYQGTVIMHRPPVLAIRRILWRWSKLFHREGIGVIFDWVPSHFPYDSHGLFMFDGTHTYEYADMRKGYHPDWNSYIFNYKRGEVKSFLISNARFWFDKFHIDGIRVDAVSSMLSLNYSRKKENGSLMNLAATGTSKPSPLSKILMKRSIVIFQTFKPLQKKPRTGRVFPGPPWQDGLGFGMKWMMGWMHDTLELF